MTTPAGMFMQNSTGSVKMDSSVVKVQKALFHGPVPEQINAGLQIPSTCYSKLPFLQLTQKG